MTELPLMRERPAGGVSTPLSFAQLRAFDAILDARSPSEFAEDHLPGAVNCPVLGDAERAHVGTVYKHLGAFEAKRVGAPLVARNIARALETTLAEKPRGWRALVYCWRGGGRSGALTHVLRQIGWNCDRLEGGYKAFRRQVVADLEVLAGHFRYHVICGATGSGKSRLLEALAAADTQVLDLEVLAAHRGSVLGGLPDAAQPTQKAFETSIWTALSRFDAERPVFVEAESKKVGDLRVPEALMERMRAGRCFRMDTGDAARVELLLEDYTHLIAHPGTLVEKIECLASLHGREAIERWIALVRLGDWRTLVADLLENHYDPAYRRSMMRNYQEAATATPIAVGAASPGEFSEIARVLAKTVR